MNQKIITVKDCGTCPFSSYGDDPPGAYCGESTPARWIAHDFDIPTPHWCPLRTGDRLVQLRVR